MNLPLKHRVYLAESLLASVPLPAAGNALIPPIKAEIVDPANKPLGTALIYPNFVELNGTLVRQLGTLESGDIAPTEAMRQAYASGCQQLATAVRSWQALSGAGLANPNALLTQNGAHAAAAPSAPLPAPVCAAPAARTRRPGR